MKKNIATTLLLLILFSAALSAQTTPPEKPVKTGNEWKMPSDVFRRSEAFADNLKKKLGLDATQTKKVYNAFLANTKSIDEIPMLPVSDEEKKEKMKANKAAFNETLKGILSPGQFEKFIKMAN